MHSSQTTKTRRPADRDGFVLPTAIFTMAILALIAVAALATANDEHRSSRAMRESNAALYAAEAGVNLVRTIQIDTSGTLLLDSIAPTLAGGDSVDLGWSSLPSGASYRAVFRRYDTGRQQMFGLTVTGRGAGPWGGERVITYMLTPMWSGVQIRAAIEGMGEFEVEDTSTVSGIDRVPAGWGAACTGELRDLPGIIARDTTQVDIHLNEVIFEGAPRMVQDATIDSTSLFNWGSLSFDDLVAQADLVLNGTVGSGSGVGPTFTGGGTVCQTGNPANWGDPLNPNSPCGDYFPIIHVNTQLEIQQGGYGQGILLVEEELEIEVGAALAFNFYGIIISRNEMELEKRVTVTGAIISGKELEAEHGPNLAYSSCAVERANRAIDSGNFGILIPLAPRPWSAGM